MKKYVYALAPFKGLLSTTMGEAVLLAVCGEPTIRPNTLARVNQGSIRDNLKHYATSVKPAIKLGDVRSFPRRDGIVSDYLIPYAS